MIFYLGTHQPGWLGRTAVPLMVSHRRLRAYRTLPRAQGSWCLDSGGFSELSLYGKWRTTAVEYAAAVRRYRDEVGGMAWAAVQDWMCEPAIRQATGLTVTEHQRRTVASTLDLLALAPELPWAPVLQGWEIDDYPRHRDAYAAAGIPLEEFPVVGLGSVCRRQSSLAAAAIVASLPGLALHGFGVKLGGLRRAAAGLHSADSMAWSYRARRDRPLPGCPHRSCANCLRYALLWRDRALAAARAPRQTAFEF